MTRKGDSFVQKLNYFWTYQDNVIGLVTWKTVVWKSKIYCVYFYVCLFVSMSYLCVNICVFVFMWICVSGPVCVWRVQETETIGLCWPPPIVVPLVPIVLAASYCAELTNGNSSPEPGGARPQCPPYTIVLQRLIFFSFLSQLHVLDPPLTKLVHYIPL